MDVDGGRTCRALTSRLVLVCAVVIFPQLSAAAEDGGYERGVLNLAGYRASVFSYTEQGSLLWLAGTGQLLRLEILRERDFGANPDVSEGALLRRQGNGWTAIVGPKVKGTVGAWGRPWREPPPGVGEMLAIVVAALDEPQQPARDDAGPWRSRASRPAPIRYPVEALLAVRQGRNPRAEFRRKSVARGLGQGGEDEVLSLQWRQESGAQGPWLVVRSTRRPGRLDLWLESRRPVAFAVPESFVPLWSLADLIKPIEPKK